MRNRAFYALGLLVVLIAGGFIWRLHFLQIQQYDYYATREKNNYTRYVTEEPIRGRILDTKGRVLAYDQTAYNVAVVPALSKMQLRLKKTCLSWAPKQKMWKPPLKTANFIPFSPWLSYRIYQNLTA